MHPQAQRTEQQQHSGGTRDGEGVVAAGDAAAAGQRVSAASAAAERDGRQERVGKEERVSAASTPVLILRSAPQSAPQNSGPQSMSALQNSLSPLPGASPLLCSTSDWDCAGHADIRIEALRVCAPPAPAGLVGRNAR